MIEQQSVGPAKRKKIEKKMTTVVELDQLGEQQQAE